MFCFTYERFQNVTFIVLISSEYFVHDIVFCQCRYINIRWRKKKALYRWSIELRRNVLRGWIAARQFYGADLPFDQSGIFSGGIKVFGKKWKGVSGAGGMKSRMIASEQPYTNWRSSIGNTTDAWT